MGMSLNTEKVIILIGTFIATLCFGMIPIKLVMWNASASTRRQQPSWLRKAISLANCFSGGVFIAACLLDLFPDVRESIDNVLNEIEVAYHTRIDYPVAEFVIVLGFLLVLIIEQVVLEVQEHWKADQAVAAANRHAGSRFPDVVSINAADGEIFIDANANDASAAAAAAETDSLLSRHSGGGGGGGGYGSTAAAVRHHHHVHVQGSTSHPPGTSNVTSANPLTEPELLRQRYISGDSQITSHILTTTTEAGSSLDDVHLHQHSTTLAVAPHDEGHHHHHDHTSGMFEEHSALRSLILLLALTFHSLFEGLAIGLQTEYGQLISIFLAVIIHKAIMAFSLGLNLAQSHGMTTSCFVAANLVFSLASPLGIAIGIGLSDLEQSLSRDVANGILQGIAGGTFLYITFFEVLPHEFASQQMRLPKVLCVLVGYSAICILLFINH